MQLLEYIESKQVEFDDANFSVSHGQTNVNVFIPDNERYTFFSVMGKTPELVIREYWNNVATPLLRLTIGSLDEVTLRRVVFAAQLSLSSVFDVQEKNCVTFVFVHHGKTYIYFPLSSVSYTHLTGEFIKTFKYIVAKREVINPNLIDMSLYEYEVELVKAKKVHVFAMMTAETVETVNEMELDTVRENYLGSAPLFMLYDPNQSLVPERKLNAAQKKKVSLFQLHLERNELKHQDNKDMCERLVPMLSHQRANTPIGLREIAQVLYDITRGSDDGLSILRKYVKLAQPSMKVDCHTLYYSLRQGNMTINNLMFWCRSDNPKEYMKYMKETMRYYIEASILPTGGITDVAEVAHQLYRDRYVCVNAKDNVWYEFTGHHWMEVHDAVTLRKEMSSAMVQIYTRECDRLNAQIEEAPNDIEQQKLSDKRDATRYIIKGLKDPGYKQKVLKELCEAFYDDTFVKEMNMNPHLFAFENGVFDCRTKEFRAGRPDDRVTISTGYDYIDYDWESPEVKDVLSIVGKIFIDRDLFECFFSMTSSVIQAFNRKKKFPNVLGKTNNGKSTLETFWRVAFGQYFCNAKTEIITFRGDSDPSGHTAHLEPLRYARIVVVHEPRGKSKLNDGEIKKHTGYYDFLQSREPHGRKQTEFRPQYILCMISNRIPDFESMDAAIGKRAMVLPCEVTFSEDAPETEEERRKTKTYPIDPTIEERVQSLAQAFMWVCIQYYKKYNGDIYIPKRVTHATERYIQSQDVVGIFMKQKMTVEEGKSTKIVSFMAQYLPWYREQYGGNASMSDVKAYLDTKGLLDDSTDHIVGYTWKSA